MNDTLNETDNQFVWIQQAIVDIAWDLDEKNGIIDKDQWKNLWEKAVKEEAPGREPANI